MNTEQIANELESKRDQMLELLEEMSHLVNSGPNHIKSRAKAYWIPHVEMALTKEHGFLGGSMCDVQDTIDELRDEVPELDR